MAAGGGPSLRNCPEHPLPPPPHLVKGVGFGFRVQALCGVWGLGVWAFAGLGGLGCLVGFREFRSDGPSAMNHTRR